MPQEEMTKDLKLVQGYIRTVEKELAVGNATEHTHRPALKTLIEGLAKGVTATNEPQRTECGAPDFLVTKGALTVGYIEAKDVGKSLDEGEKSEQLKRYLDSLTNLILTDYLEFRWYVTGERRLSVRLGTPTKDGKIKRDKANIQAVAELLSDFLAHKAEAVGTPRELAKRMARLAHRLRELVTAAFEKKLNLPSLGNLYKAFCDTLVPDLTIEQFADMYAQTIAYGLFAARCNSPNSTKFTRQYARDLVPKTNPFLRNIFDHIAGAGLPEIIAPEVDDLAQLLAQADMTSVTKDFGKHTAKEDPVVHFYETFLAQYDPVVREMRGVYYTPEPVVSYIVRSIDHLLKTRFNKPQGLADDKTLILDPAVGTATFLYMVVNEIYEAMLSQKQKGMWNDYVAEKLLPRLFGFELLMAPYAVAHLKLGLLLQETGYQFKSDQRLGIYLTNTLEEAIKHSEVLFARWISEEANAAAQIKKEKPIMVVLGNPPYSGHSANKGPWARQLVETYKKDIRELHKPAQAKWLQDDYVKFIAFGQWRIERTGQGILGFITNHAYLDNPTFRGMRQSLINTFSDIYILNLHGSVKKKEAAPDGSKDENVFDIQQGVAIGIFIKEKGKESPAKIRYADIWGGREGKYRALFDAQIDTTNWQELEPQPPFYLFVPQDTSRLNEYNEFWKISDVMNQNGDPAPGIVTTHDQFAISWSEEEAKDKVSRFLETTSEDEARGLFRLCSQSQWNYDRAKRELSTGGWLKNIKPILYRPFDMRWTILDANVAVHRRERVMRHILAGANIGLCTDREVNGDFRHVLCTRQLIDDCTVSLQTRERTYIFPLYLYPAENEMQFEEGRRPNLNPEFIKAVSDKLGLKFVSDGKGDLVETFGPEDVFNYAYAVFHSPTYRSRYAEFLKMDFPRLPLTSDKGLFKTLVEKGAELVSLHLMESPVLEQQRIQIKFDVSGSNVVEKVTYNETAKRVYINKEQYFEDIDLEVWNFHIGGYQVCQKWLKDRKSRKLSYDDLVHYQKIVVAIKETIRLMEEMDEVIEEHGGWPLDSA
jgi:predicted helicase